MRFIMANDQRTIYAHYKYGQPRIGRKKKNKNAVQRGRSSWSQIAFTLAAIEADINKSQNKELQMVQCHIHFGVTRVRHSADTVGQLSGISIEKYSTKL